MTTQLLPVASKDNSLWFPKSDGEKKIKKTSKKLFYY